MEVVVTLVIGLVVIMVVGADSTHVHMAAMADSARDSMEDQTADCPLAAVLVVREVADDFVVLCKDAEVIALTLLLVL